MPVPCCKGGWESERLEMGLGFSKSAKKQGKSVLPETVRPPLPPDLVGDLLAGGPCGVGDLLGGGELSA